MQNPKQKFRQRSIIFEKPGILPGILETFNIFCWNFAHFSYLPMFVKECAGFFLILFRSSVTCKN